MAYIFLKDLPKTANVRWTPKRKAAVVLAVRQGLREKADMLALYNITAAEFDAWSADMDASGVAALRATRLQEYRAMAA